MLLRRSGWRFLMSTEPTAEPWEYGFYDSHPDGNWRDDPQPQENPIIYWYTFGGLVGFESAEMAMHTASKSVWGQPVIVRRRKGSIDWEHVEVPDER